MISLSYDVSSIHITSVSSVELVSALCLNLPIQTLGCLFSGVIVPIPPHTQNIMGMM